MRDELRSALRIRAAAEELRQIARRLARPDDRVALISVASSLDTKAAILDSATISVTKRHRSQLERYFDHRNRWRTTLRSRSLTHWSAFRTDALLRL
jgi:hypothetical protein